MTGPIVVASVGDGSRGGFTDTIEVVAAVARGLADAQGARVHWAVPGALASAARQQAGTLGVDQVDAIGGGDWSPAGPDAAVEALAAFAAARSPGVILLAQTFEGRLTAARLGARLRAAVLTNALEVKAAGSTLEVTASAFGGDVRAIYSVDASGLVILTVLPAATGAAAGGAREVSFEELAAPSAGSDRVEILEPAESTGPRLEEAKIVVSGGRGLGKVENYHLVEELAAALGGIAGASRPIVDEGWVDSSRQVGLTGRITRPDLYFAAGISGASQHMAGCSASRVIVAVNTDQQAPIFRYARFGVVADCLEILPAVTKAVKG